MKSIKHKLIALFAGVLTVTLGAMALTLTLDERSRITADITESVVHFAELSGEQIAHIYDLYYRSQSFALFDAELRAILDREPAVARVQLVNATGELLFDSAVAPDQLADDAMIDEATRARLTVNRLSIARNAEVAFLARDDMHAAGYAAADATGSQTETTLMTSAIDTVVYPLSDDRRRVVLHPSYAKVQEETIAAIISLSVLFLFGFVGSLLISSWFAGTITAPLLALRDGALQIAKGDLKAKITVDTQDETRVLADTFNKMSTDLAAAVDTKVEFERAQKEFEVARDIQQGILPQAVTVSGLDVGVMFRPATEVGGDVYDVVTTKSGKQLLYIGDATGHGVPAGMVAALTSAAIGTVARTSDDLSEILTQANSILFEKTKSTMFVTVMALLWDEDAGELSYATAGHEPFLIRRANGDIETGGTGSMGLGMLPELTPRPEVHTVDLVAGDALLTMTDGIFEAEKKDGVQVGVDGLKDIFTAAAKRARTAEEIAREVLVDFDDVTGGSTQEDDITFFVIRR